MFKEKCINVEEEHDFAQLNYTASPTRPLSQSFTERGKARAEAKLVCEMNFIGL